jgi:hypothetical protein
MEKQNSTLFLPETVLRQLRLLEKGFNLGFRKSASWDVLYGR